MDDVNLDLVCIVCQVVLSEVSLIPCGHRLCIPCEEKCPSCPMCRASIRGRVFVMQT